MIPDEPTTHDSQAAASEPAGETPASPAAVGEAASAPQPSTPEGGEARPRETATADALPDLSVTADPTALLATPEPEPSRTPDFEAPAAVADPAPHPFVDQPAAVERPRVTLNPTGAADARPVPSLQSDQTPVPGLEGAAPQPPPQVDSPPEMAPRPMAPLAGAVGQSVEIPRVAEIDPEFEAELTAVMADNPLSAMINAKAAEAGPPQPIDVEALQPGRRLKGTIQTIADEDVFVDLGMRSPGLLQKKQFDAAKPPEVGQEVEVVVDHVNLDDGTVAVSLPRARRKPAGNWDAVSQGQIVDALVTKTNKGGLEVTVGSLRGFLPASQIDLGFVENMEAYVGQKLTCAVTEVNPAKRNLVLSRRSFLMQERKEKEKDLWQSLAIGQTLPGVVKTVKDYGAFVDLGGVDGFLHVGEISWNRVNHPSDVLKVGDQIEVKVLKLEPETKKIGLGMKQLASNPWLNAENKYPVGSTVSGKVTRTTEFGAFIEIERGVEGLVHISELEHRRVGRVNEIVNEGDQVDAKVLAVEPNRKRISLSLKALKTAPESAKPAAPPELPPYERKRKEPLRGGADTGGRRSGMFGNPDDFKR